MNKIRIISLLGFLVISQTIFSQQVYSLENLISVAKQTSPKAIKAKLQLKNAEYSYDIFRSGFLPQVSAFGTLPSVDRTIQNNILDDGSIGFVSVNQMNTFGGVNVSQKIGLTGSEVFVNTHLQQYRNFYTDFTNYYATPLSVGIRQPIVRGNPYRFDKIIQAQKLEVAKRKYSETMEEIAIEVSDLYFEQLISQITIEIAQKNVSLNDTLFKIAEGRYNLGKIAENELLQMKLSFMNSTSDLRRAEIDQQANQMQLKRYLNWEDSIQFSLLLPSRIPNFAIGYELALKQSLENKSRILEFEIRKLETEKQLKMAKAENRMNADLNITYGFVATSPNFNTLYATPNNQQGLNIGVSIPLWNGGQNRSQVKMAEATAEIQEIDIKQEQANFEMETKLFIQQFPLFRDQLQLAFQADTIAMKRYDIAVKRYLIGKTDITDLNIALNERNQATRSLLSNLKAYWMAYYRLRFNTLYDFEKNEAISY